MLLDPPVPPPPKKGHKFREVPTLPMVSACLPGPTWHSARSRALSSVSPSSKSLSPSKPWREGLVCHSPPSSNLVGSLHPHMRPTKGTDPGTSLRVFERKLHISGLADRGVNTKGMWQLTRDVFSSSAVWFFTNPRLSSAKRRSLDTLYLPKSLVLFGHKTV